MVKYVEGSFDEDYIQTLGGYSSQISIRKRLAEAESRIGQ